MRGRGNSPSSPYLRKNLEYACTACYPLCKMPRANRIEFPDAFYHVISRSVAGESAFELGDEKNFFLSILANVIERYDWVCHAFCIMGNHYHLLIQTKDGNLARGMRELNGIFAQSYNLRRQRTGHVFQARYKAVLIRRESHLLELARYIVLNPVRAGLVKRPEQWAWSSYRAMIGTERTPEFLCVSFLLSMFHIRMSESRDAYCQFVLSGINVQPPRKAKGVDIYIDENEKHKLLVDSRKIQIEPKVCKPIEVLLKKEAPRTTRDKMIVNAYACGYSVQEIADYLELHYSTISKIIKRGARS